MIDNVKYTVIKSVAMVVFWLLCFASAALPLQTGAERIELYLHLLTGKRIGITANHTSLVGRKHLIDVLVENRINVVRIFAPEHGFYGAVDAGKPINTVTNEQTGIAMVSLYGKNVKPLPEQLHDIDFMIFDIQDVGVRFYTYLSTMHYVMEACAENDIPLIVLDRPNPNGFYVDGAVLESKYRSFVGMHPIPIVHGMTLGELARMINGEGWLKNKVKCDLTVIPCTEYTHQTKYALPVKPSPNLPTMQAIYLYPSLCLFEGTVVSVGRGTDTPFELFGHPAFKSYHTFTFVPISKNGARHPQYKNDTCYGVNLHDFPIDKLINNGRIRLEWLIDAYQYFTPKDIFFTDFFYKLCGTDNIRRQIEQGLSAEEIRASWSREIIQFKTLRKKYLLYEE